jgi:hypothetical protein
MLTLRLTGMTLGQIGERMEVGIPTVSRVISKALAAHTREPALELIALEVGRCDLLLLEAMQTVKAFHPMIAGGQVVSAPLLNDRGELVRNPESGDVLTQVVEDKAPKLAAIHVAVKVMERRSKLLGLDAATKMQQEVTVITDAPAQDLNKLNDNDLNLYGYLISKTPDDTSPRNVRNEVREKLTPAEVGTLQAIFRKLDVQYLALDTVHGLYSEQLALPNP